ncbi:EscU/YscU/HrcU family type III secretion system export apparatus switch protein [Gimesia fumaroli]|uniref:Uncharacterized protein n=1 Tax=Gimesia fumaroli TaxID=2527976 RepID=A0A518IKL5_9PLAN|nr:EscU/YscU/HrcU family type III secretion system export apparatus switch protein [Gimesia fumaroli]QDV53631.1 hypothetical protein Enr17x_57120 [Gimesia fumaroli]
MTTALYVTTKDFCKRAWIGALLAVGTLVMAPLLFLVITRLQGLNLEYMEHDLTGYHFAYLGLSWIAFLGVSLHALSGSEKICRALPVSSRAIASWLMFSMVGLVVVLQLLTNGVYRMLFFDEHWLADYWPLLGPLLFIVTLILVGHCFYWSLHAPSFTRLFLGAALVLGMLFWFLSRYYPNGFHAEEVPWSRVTLGEFVLMQFVSIAAWYQGTRAFAQVRAGTAVPSPAWERVEVWWNGLLSGAIPEKQPEPFSRRSALTKLHWRDSCRRAVILGGLLFGGIVLVITLGIGFQLNSDQTSVREIAEGYWAITMLASFVASILVAFLLGDGMCNKGRTEMRTFLAIAPLPDQDLNTLLFRNMVTSSVLTLAMIFSALFLSLGITTLLWGPEVLNFMWEGLFGGSQYLLRFLLIGIGFWVLASNAVSVFWTGRTWFINTVVGVGFGGFILYVVTFNLLGAFFRGSWVAAAIVSMMLLAVYSLIVGCTFTAYLIAWRKAFISWKKAVLALLIWCSLGAIFSVTLLNEAARSGLEPRWGMFWIYSAISAFVLAPFATIPLALSWNRHR